MLLSRFSVIAAFLLSTVCIVLCATVATSSVPPFNLEQCGGAPVDQSGCRLSNDTSTPLCSGRGTCVCGACLCNMLADPFQVISGMYCECDNFSCVRRNGLICSGALHGECVCGQCVCAPGYRTDKWGDCSACPVDESTCVAPESGEICSGHGKCVCGQCECDAGDGEQQYSGSYCERCPTCPGRCSDFKNCIECEVHGRGHLYNPDAEVGHRCGECSLSPSIVEGTLNEANSLQEHLCRFYDDDDCLFAFTYYYDNHWRLNLRAQKERTCPQKSGFAKIFDWFG